MIFPRSDLSFKTCVLMPDTYPLGLITVCAEEICRGEGWVEGTVRVLEHLGKSLVLSRMYLAEIRSREALEWQIWIQHQWMRPDWQGEVGAQEDSRAAKRYRFEGKVRELEMLAPQKAASANLSNFSPEARQLLGSPSGGVLLIAPVVVAGKQWGFLGGYDPNPGRQWSSEEITVLQAVAELLAASIERSHKLRRRSKRRERLAELVEEIPEIFWAVVGGKLELLYASPSFERMWGCSRQDFIGDPLGFLKHLHPEDREQAERALNFGALLTETASREEQFIRVLWPAGETRWIEMRYSVLRGEERGTGFVMGLAADMTAHKQRELYWLTQRETLIREVHHRIKNHLQGLIGLLRQHVQRSPQLDQPMQAAISQVSAIAAIHGLQALNQCGQIKLGETARAICHNVSQIVRCPICFNEGTQDISLIIEQEAVPVALVVNELVLNAYKHRSIEEGEIRVRLTASGSGRRAELLIFNGGASLQKGFDFASGKGLGTGLELIKSLLPPTGVELTINERAGGVEARLVLSSPVLHFIT